MATGWIQAKWLPGGARVNNPTKPGWYAAVPESCDRCVQKVFVDPDLLDVYVENDDLRHDVYDFVWWYPLKSQRDRLPQFRG